MVICPPEVESKIVYSPTDILRMIDGRFNAILSEVGTLGFIRVSGVLGPVKDTKYTYYYGVELRDVSSGGDILFLDIPKSLAPEDLVGKEVYVGGFLQSKRGLKVSLQVTKLVSKITTSVEVLKEEKSLRDILSLPTDGSSEFPKDWEALKICCIHGTSSLVLDDFHNQLEDIPLEEANIRIENCATNILDADAIVNTIKSISADIVIIMRGGGAEGEFEVFNRTKVLSAWRELNAFKISALGHTRNRTILDRFSHKVCDTPTDAGQYMMKRIGEEMEIRRLIHKANFSDSKQLEAVKALTIEIEALKRQNRELEVLSKVSKSNQWLWVAFAFAIGVIIALMLKAH